MVLEEQEAAHRHPQEGQHECHPEPFVQAFSHP